MKGGIVVSHFATLGSFGLCPTEPQGVQAVEQLMVSNKKDPKKSARPNFNFYWVYAGIGALLIAMILSGSSPSAGSVSFQQLIFKAEKGEFRKLTHNGMVAEAWYTDAARDSIMKGKERGPLGGGFIQGADLVVEIPPSEKNIDRLDQLSADGVVTVTYKRPNEWGQQLVFYIIVLAVMVGVWMVLMRRLGGGAPVAARFSTSASPRRSCSTRRTAPRSTSTKWPDWTARRRSWRR